MDEQQKNQVNVMLYASTTLSRAYSYKEDILNIFSCNSREQAQKYLIKWINCGIEPFQKCAKTMLTWITVFLILSPLNTLMVLLKAVITKLRCLYAMLMATVISLVLEIEFYIYFLTKDRQQLNCRFLFYLLLFSGYPNY